LFALLLGHAPPMKQAAHGGNKTDTVSSKATLLT